MLCNKCGGFGNYPYDFTVDMEGNTIHITCTEDCKNSIKTDAMVIMQAVICGILGTTSYKQGKYHTPHQAANDSLIQFSNRSPVTEISVEDQAQIVWDIYLFAGQLGYKTYVMDERGFTFTNKTKNRSIVYEFPFSQIKEKLDALTYNENIINAMENGNGEFESYNGECIWCGEIDCNESECEFDRNLNSCGWLVNIGLSFDYIQEHGKPFFNFFKDDFKGIVAVWKDNGKVCGLMHDMSRIDYLEDKRDVKE